MSIIKKNTFLRLSMEYLKKHFKLENLDLYVEILHTNGSNNLQFEVNKWKLKVVNII